VAPLAGEILAAMIGRQHLRASSLFTEVIDRICLAIVERAERTSLRRFERALTIDGSLPSAASQLSNIVSFPPKRAPSQSAADSSSSETG
jgi:hypothetical protein